MMSFPVHLVSVEGPEKTTIRAASANKDARSHFRLTHADALLAGFTLSEARIDPYDTSDKGAASLRISAGVVSNCVVTGSNACRSDYGAVHVSGTGLLTHTVIRNSNYRFNQETHQRKQIIENAEKLHSRNEKPAPNEE